MTWHREQISAWLVCTVLLWLYDFPPLAWQTLAGILASAAAGPHFSALEYFLQSWIISFTLACTACKHAPELYFHTRTLGFSILDPLACILFFNNLDKFLNLVLLRAVLQIHYFSDSFILAVQFVFIFSRCKKLHFAELNCDIEVWLPPLWFVSHLLIFVICNLLILCYTDS